MFQIPDSESNHWFTPSQRGCPGYSHGELVVAIGSRVSRKTVNSVGRGPAYQDSGESHIARQQYLLTSAEPRMMSFVTRLHFRLESVYTALISPVEYSKHFLPPKVRANTSWHSREVVSRARWGSSHSRDIGLCTT